MVIDEYTSSLLAINGSGGVTDFHSGNTIVNNGTYKQLTLPDSSTVNGISFHKTSNTDVKQGLQVYLDNEIPSTSDWTIEYWLNTWNTSENSYIWCLELHNAENNNCMNQLFGDSGLSFGLALTHSNGGYYKMNYSYKNNYTIANHIAIVRHDGYTSLYFNGKKQGLSNWTNTNYTTYDLNYGAFVIKSYMFDLWGFAVSGVRLSNIARYSKDFNPYTSILYFYKIHEDSLKNYYGILKS